MGVELGRCVASDWPGRVVLEGGYFCPTHRKGKIGALPEFRAHQLCLQRLSNIAVTGGNLLPGTVGSCRLDAVY